MGTQSSSRGNEDARRNDAVRTEKAAFRVVEVHRASAASRTSTDGSQQLCHRGARGDALRQGVTMAAVRAGDIVIAAQLCTYTGSNGFFAHVDMDKPGHTAGPKHVAGFEFKFADQNHAAVQRSNDL